MRVVSEFSISQLRLIFLLCSYTGIRDLTFAVTQLEQEPNHTDIIGQTMTVPVSGSIIQIPTGKYVAVIS